MDNRQEIKSAYNKWASVYDSVENKTRDLDKIVIRKIIPDLAGKKVVEIGCGTGKNTVWLSESAEEVMAIDMSEEMMKQAKTKINSGNVTFLLHDITTAWNIGSVSADIIVTNLVLEHIENIHFIFCEAYRVLKPGGYFYVSELHPEKQAAGTKANFIDPETKGRVEIAAYYHSKDEFESAARKAGFKEVVLQDWYHPCNSAIPRILSVAAIK